MSLRSNGDFGYSTRLRRRGFQTSRRVPILMNRRRDHTRVSNQIHPFRFYSRQANFILVCNGLTVRRILHHVALRRLSVKGRRDTRLPRITVHTLCVNFLMRASQPGRVISNVSDQSRERPILVVGKRSISGRAIRTHGLREDFGDSNVLKGDSATCFVCQV